MKFRAALLTAALSLGWTAANASDEDATAMAQAFCALRTVDWGSARINLVSPSLAEAIEVAMQENDRIQAAAPDEKPPLGDGIPWQSYPDVADSCDVGQVSHEGEAALVEVKYGFSDNADAGWSDRLVLVSGEGGVVLVDDVRYGPEGDSDTLRGVLVGVFSQ